MKSREQIIRGFVLQWLDKADTDLDSADILAAADLDDYFTCAFHCQQAVEKYLKAYLVRHQVEFRKTHDLDQLIELASQIEPVLREELALCEWLTPFGTEYRYPGETPKISRLIAQSALTEAQRAKETITRHLGSYLAV